MMILRTLRLFKIGENRILLHKNHGVLDSTQQTESQAKGVAEYKSNIKSRISATQNTQPQ